MDDDHPRIDKRQKLISIQRPPPQAAIYSTRVYLKVGSVITIEGKVQRQCKSFSINLNTDIFPDTDIGLHFNPRFEQRYIVRNCRIEGYWGEEETSSNMPFIFQKNKEFTVGIFAAEREFMISVNGQDWCSFTYRIPLSEIAIVEVRGLVDVTDINTKTIKTYPEIVTPIPIIAEDETITIRKVPYIGLLPSGFTVGWEIDIVAKLALLPQTFFVNLQDSEYHWPHPTIPLHLNPRFSIMGGVNVFTLNAWYDGYWGVEERAMTCPFLPGSEFLMHIRHESCSYSVWLADDLIVDFRFKGPFSNAKYVYIAGDVTIYNITMQQRSRICKPPKVKKRRF